MIICLTELIVNENGMVNEPIYYWLQPDASKIFG